MDLATYLHREAIDDREFARLVQRDRTTVMRWRCGKTRPDWESLAVIERVTKGRVTASDFIPAEAAE